MVTQSLRSFHESASVQFRVIHALLLREILTRYGRHNIGFLWLFVEPMIFTTGVTILWSLTKSVHGSSLPIVAFALTGYSSVLLWRNMPARCIHAVMANLPLMYHRNVRVLDIFLARLILEAAGATISFITLASFYAYIGWLELPINLLEVVGGWFLLGWFGLALGIFVGALAERTELIEKLWHPISYLAFPLSGAAFTVDALPPEARQYILYIPMVNGVEIVREGYFGNVIRAHYDVGYMVVCCLVLTLAALSQVVYVSRHVTPE